MLHEFKYIQFCASVMGVYPYKSLNEEEPEEPISHSVTGNGKRDGSESRKK